MDLLRNAQIFQVLFACCTEHSEVSGTVISCCTRTPGKGMFFYEITQKFRVQVWKMYVTEPPTEPTDVSGTGICRVNTSGTVLYVPDSTQPWNLLSEPRQCAVVLVANGEIILEINAFECIYSMYSEKLYTTHPYIYAQRDSVLLTTQMTGTRQHERSTTLRVQPCRTAAVAGYMMYVRVTNPRYAAASCFRLHEGTILNGTTIKTIQA